LIHILFDFIFNKNILINQINRTAIALRGKDGIVLAVEKLVTSKLYEVGANKRIFTVDRHIGVAVAGLLADARAIVENAREEAKNYRSEYGSPIPIKVLLLRV
jgi:20S proteasome subunit alpha 7